MSDKVVLYDLGRRGSSNTCWSYNVWKTRLVLNYKSIPYTTVWVDHTTIGSTVKALGVPPNTSGQGPEYTVPTIKLPEGKAVTDSAIIAEQLETLYPTPSLHLDATLQAEAERVIQQIAAPLFPVYMPRIAREIIPERAVAFFTAQSEQRFGMTLAELEASAGGEQAWLAADEGFTALKALLTEHKTDEGPFVLGSRVCYADFILVSLFEAMTRVGEDLLQKALTKDAAFGTFYGAASEWLQKDD